jgi:hypothetical protein
LVLAKGVANQKDTASGARGKGSLRAGVGNGRKAAIEPSQLGACGRAVSLGKGSESHVELRVQAKLGSGAAKVDDRDADRQRRHEVCALQRIGRVGYCRKAMVHAVFPIFARMQRGGRRGEPAEVAQRKGRQPPGLEVRESGGTRRKDIAPIPHPTSRASAVSRAARSTTAVHRALGGRSATAPFISVETDMIDRVLSECYWSSPQPSMHILDRYLRDRNPYGHVGQPLEDIAAHCTKAKIRIPSFRLDFIFRRKASEKVSSAFALCKLA